MNLRKNRFSHISLQLELKGIKSGTAREMAPWEKKITCSASLRTRVQVLRTHVSRTQKLTFNSGAYKVKTRDLQSKLMAIQSFK